MSDPGSITQWIGGLREGSSEAAEAVWCRFHQRLIGFAKQRLQGTQCRVADEDDVIVDAFDSFFRGVQAGRFPKLADRDDLWEVLLLLTSRKSVNQRVASTRQKRGSGEVRGESVFGSVGPDDFVHSPDPTPEFAAEFAEQLRICLAGLPDPVLRKIALMKMEGYSNSEIAESIGRKERTVQRKLRTIREFWLIADDDNGGT